MPDHDRDDSEDDLAAAVAREVRVAVGRLHRRLRLVAEGGLSASQSSVLARVAKGEADTAAALAALDGVRPQSMAATVAALERDGLLARTGDPEDGRRAILRLTEEGEALFRGEPGGAPGVARPHPPRAPRATTSWPRCWRRRRCCSA